MPSLPENMDTSMPAYIGYRGFCVSSIVFASPPIEREIWSLIQRICQLH